MAHVRQQIRDQIVTTLTGLTTTETRVSSTPVYAAASLPALEIRTTSEDVNLDDLATLGTVQYRELTVEIEAKVSQANNADDLLDTVCKEVEVAMAADHTLNGKAKDSHYTGGTFERTEGEQPIHLATLTYVVHYRVDVSDPETLVN